MICSHGDGDDDILVDSDEDADDGKKQTRSRRRLKPAATEPKKTSPKIVTEVVEIEDTPAKRPRSSRLNGSASKQQEEGSASKRKAASVTDLTEDEQPASKSKHFKSPAKGKEETALKVLTKEDIVAASSSGSRKKKDEVNSERIFSETLLRKKRLLRRS
jgi:hypothetical protein